MERNCFFQGVVRNTAEGNESYSYRKINLNVISALARNLSVRE